MMNLPQPLDGGGGCCADSEDGADALIRDTQCGQRHEYRRPGARVPGVIADKNRWYYLYLSRFPFRTISQAQI